MSLADNKPATAGNQVGRPGLRWRRIAGTVASSESAETFAADTTIRGLRLVNPATSTASLWWSDVVDDEGVLIAATVGQCHELPPGATEYWSAAGPPLDGVSVIAGGDADVPFILEKGNRS